MFRVHTQFEVAEVGARHRSMEARAEGLRIGYHRGENVSTDYGLLDRAVGLTPQSRSAITILLEGQGRFDERRAREWITPGTLAISDQNARGTEAYAGPVSWFLVFEWDPRVVGAPAPSSFRTTKLDTRDLERLKQLTLELDGPDPAKATLSVLAILRANGLPLAPIGAADLADRTTAADRALTAAVQTHLARLEAHPAIEDVVSELGWTSRHVNRRLAALAEAYGVPWEHWRKSLHLARMLAAFRLLSVGATTELVSRKTGFRSPTALCHAFAKAGLPSPGVLARAARSEVLDAWTSFMGPKDAALAAE